MNYCEWTTLAKGGGCTRCGYVLRRDYPKAPGRMCDKQDEPLPALQSRMGLGDLIAAGLSTVGITKPFVEAIIGGPCGCTERQEALNDLGQAIGL
jgi:hypothetical protein